MTCTKAVELALAGNQAGFDALYQNTYKQKLYLATKYMGSLEAAQDVLQDAYIKAFSKLDTLQEPERFPAWLGQIVVNTAKNTLSKKTPLLFSELSPEDDHTDSRDDFDIPDQASNPAVQYSAKETQEMVHALIDMLSVDQKMCILMYYIDGLSVSEIAAALECSENTVKSRLNYGRKHIKVQAEALQKKGYKLYSLAPLPLLLLLLRSQAQDFAQSEAAAVIGKAMGETVMQSVAASGSTAASAAGTAAKYALSLRHGLAVKIAAVIIGAGVIIGGVIMVVPNLTDREPEISVQSEDAQPQTEPQTEPQAEPQVEPEQASPQTETTIPTVLSDEQYPEILQGGLTREEFEFVLAAAPTTLTEAGMDEWELTMFSNYATQAAQHGILDIPVLGEDTQMAQVNLSLTEFNRYLSVLGEPGYSAETHPDQVEEDRLTITIADGIYVDAEITDSSYSETDLYVEYIHQENIEALVETLCTAHLQPNEQGRFVVVSITEGGLETVEPTSSSDAALPE